MEFSSVILCFSKVVLMNALTVNLHLLLVSFYQPTQKRHKILIESRAFPTDQFAVESQIKERGYDPKECLIMVEKETVRNVGILLWIGRIVTQCISGCDFCSQFSALLILVLKNCGKSQFDCGLLCSQARTAQLDRFSFDRSSLTYPTQTVSCQTRHTSNLQHSESWHLVWHCRWNCTLTLKSLTICILICWNTVTQGC